MIPLSKPILATVGLMSAVSYWNDWNNGLYYITDSNLFSIQQLLNEMNNNVNFLANNSSMLLELIPEAADCNCSLGNRCSCSHPDPSGISIFSEVFLQRVLLWEP